MAEQPPVPPTMAHMLGEMVWVMSQSPVYKRMAIGDLEWMLMPPMLLNQYRVFHAGAQPVGFALWAQLSEAVEKRLNESVTAGKTLRLEPKDWNSGDRLWLIELVCPAANTQNQLNQKLVADLANTVFKNKPFSFHQIQAGGKEGRKVTVNGGAADSPLTVQ